MVKPICFNCAYLVEPERLKSFRELLSFKMVFPICVNHADSPGQAREVHPAETCRNFCPRWRPAEREAPPEPTEKGVRHIPLTRGKFAIVDEEDFERLNRYKWHAICVRGKWYARRAPGGKVIMMHREIMKAPKDKLVDHIDGNGLNNRRCNLRFCTQQQNMQNRRPLLRTSRFKGVSYCKNTEKFHAEITRSRRKTFIGSFDDEIEAAKAYDRKAIELFGEFAYLNFPHAARANAGAGDRTKAPSPAAFTEGISCSEAARKVD